MYYQTYDEYVARYEIELEISITVFTLDPEDEDKERMIEHYHTFETAVECNEFTGEYSKDSRDEKIEAYIRKQYGQAEDWELGEVSEGYINYAYNS